MADGVECGTQALGELLARGDATAAAALYADDGKLLSSTADLVVGRREIEQYWRAGIALGISLLAVDAVEVAADGAVAVETGRYVLTGGAVVLDQGKYVALHRRQADGTWRRAVDVFNPDLRTKEER